MEVMGTLGFSQFRAVGHDRGGRVLHRMMLDYTEAITCAAVLDIAPADLVYVGANNLFVPMGSPASWQNPYKNISGD